MSTNDWSAYRVTSSLIAVVYLVVGFQTGGIERILRVLGFCVLPLACIWFPQTFAEYTDPFSLGRSRITRESPPVFVWFMGWLVLLLPAIVAIVFRLVI